MPELLDHDIASDGDYAFEQAQINRVLAELEANHIDHRTINDVQEKLNMAATARIDYPQFSITRNLNHGFDLIFHPTQKAA